MSIILDSIKETIPASAYGRKLSHAAAAAHMTMIRTARLGTCMTLSDERIFEFKENQPVSHLGEIESLSLEEILSWTDSLQGIERSFAIAAINGSINLDGRYFGGNALELAADLSLGKNVAMIGHFPHTEKFKKSAKNFWILEKRPKDGDVPAEDYVKILPESDVVVATGVTCLNDTIEGLLKVKKPGSLFIVVGPSVPLSPVLFDFGVDIIGGAYVEDETDVYRKILQGASPRSIKDSLKTVLYGKNLELFAKYKEVFPKVKSSL